MTRARCLVVAFGLVVADASGCSERGEPPSAAPSGDSASSSGVRWRPARSAATSPLLEAPAIVLASADGRAVIAPPLRARVVAVVTTVGREVSAGAPLVEVAMPEAAAAAATYLASSSQIAAHEARAAQLGELRKEGLARMADQATIELELARLRGERDVAATALRAAGLGVASAASLAAGGGHSILRAPRAGVVVKLTAVVGAAASPDEALVEVIGGGSTRVEVALAAPLPTEAAFEIEVAQLAATPAHLVSVAPAREPDGATRAWFDTDAALPAGALGRLRVRLRDGAAAAVPATALGRDAAGSFVWLRDTGRPRRADVRVIATSGADALVAGVHEGELVASVASAIAAEPVEGPR